MSIQIEQKSIRAGVLRGLTGRCPQCGRGHLFSSYLKVAAACAACGHDTGVYRADDGPAYFTILIVGHLVIAPLLFLEFVRSWPVGWVLAVVVPTVIALALLLLPRVKGAFVGVQWAIGDRSRR